MNICCPSISTVAGWAAVNAADAALRGEIGLGQLEPFIMSSMNKFFDKYGPQIAQQFSAVAEPAAKKAAEIIGPVVEEKLKQEGPKLALLTGAVIGAAILFAGWFARREARLAKGRRAA